MVETFIANRMILGDSIKVIKTIPDKSVQCTITDPPYGVDLDYDSYNDTFANWKRLIKTLIPEAIRVTAGPVLISTSKLEAEEFLFKKFPPLWRVCWYKGASCTRSPIGFKDWETLFVYGSVPKQTHDYFTVHANNVRKEIPNHPCPKPIGWAKWLIKNFSNEGDIIFDPFAGSGTTCLAALQLNRRYIGTEISPKYYKVAKNRLDNHPLKLFCGERLITKEISVE